MRFPIRILCLPLSLVYSTAIDFLALGGIPSLETLTAAEYNTALLNNTLASLAEGDVFVIPNQTFYFNGGVYANNLTGITFQLDGTMTFLDGMSHCIATHVA